MCDAAVVRESACRRLLHMCESDVSSWRGSARWRRRPHRGPCASPPRGTRGAVGGVLSRRVRRTPQLSVAGHPIERQVRMTGSGMDSRSPATPVPGKDPHARVLPPSRPPPRRSRPDGCAAAPGARAPSSHPGNLIPHGGPGRAPPGSRAAPGGPWPLGGTVAEHSLRLRPGPIHAHLALGRRPRPFTRVIKIRMTLARCSPDRGSVHVSRGRRCPSAGPGVRPVGAVRHGRSIRPRATQEAFRPCQVTGMPGDI
jgi:hypothetical protein